MKNLYCLTQRVVRMLLLITAGFWWVADVVAQQATVAIPVGIGSPCGVSGSASDSVKYFGYSSTTKTLTHRSICKPTLATPGFSDNLASITFNPYDGYLYFTQIAQVSGVYNSYTYRWLPTACPNLATLPVYKTFLNQFVAGVEFNPATGLAYQINFVDSTGIPPVNPDETGIVGQYSSGASVNGFPAIAYYDGTNRDLKFVRASDANGINWATPISISTAGDVGQYASLVIVNGNPAISYYDVTNGDLKYVRAIDANGTTWGTPVTVESASNIGQYTTLLVVNGNPAISYYDVTNGDLRYSRATDANGTAWGTPVAITTAGNVGQYTSMEIVNGQPAISYYDVTNGDLKFVRATNANGTAWATPITLDATNNVGQFTSLAIVNGNPAISYYHVGDGDLRYIRATDINGATWGAPLQVSTGGIVGSHTSLKIINGYPAISFFDDTNNDLEYVRATNADGSAWSTPVIAEAANDIGYHSSLFVANGRPAIVYYDNTARDVKYVRANDVNGDQWYRNSGIFKMELQEVDFTNGTLGALKPINFGARYIYRQSGDVVLTPGGQMLASFNNKYFTINWKDYNTANPLVATYIDSLYLGTTNNLIGLSYSDGKLVGSVKANSGCSSTYKEINILSGAQLPVNYNASPGSPFYVSADMTTIISGIGAAKRLVTATENPVGSQTYDIVYEVIIKNYGSTPVTNVQAFDTLNRINGIANLISGSITGYTGPSGISINPLFDGKTAGNFSLLLPGAVLSNIPGENTITLQITCKVAGLQPGIVYNNQVAVTGIGLFGDNLRDLSTDGSNPDLNLNDKPDDVGENQPTPLLISVTALTPPCTTLTNVLYGQDFGAGTGLAIILPTPVTGLGVTLPTAVTNYAGSLSQPLTTEAFTLTNNAQLAHTADFISLPDHTGNANGRMLVVNADANNEVMYRGSFQANLCANQQYSLSFYAAFTGNAAYQTICNAFGGFQYPRIKIRVRDGVSGLIITEVSTTSIVATTWQHLGLKFISPASYTNIIFELVNDAPGGCGNDIAIDDIQFGSCDALPVVSVNSVAAGCVGGTTTFTATLNDPAALPGAKDYQWEVASLLAGPYTVIPGATAATYSIPVIAGIDTGKFYRVVIAAAGNIGSISCRYTSPGMLLSGKAPSLAAAGATKNKNNICPGIAVTLGITGGSLGNNAVWRWYTASCGGTPAGTGATIIVNPAITTTYYVRAEGDCNITACQWVTVFIACDIDKDKDGLPDYVESNMPLAFQDANSNGINNAFDPTYPGFVDVNNDYINDNFQADGDADADGIPNYLDTSFPGRVDTNSDGVDDRFDNDLDGIINMLDLDSDNDGIPDTVEAYGVDENGDGKIDNYTDTDNDGLSQNVDGNNTGVTGSGLGLGIADLDGDGVPNCFDLDSDNDGIPDVVEAGGTDANNNGLLDGYTDTDADGLSDLVDGDVGNDLVAENTASALLRTGADTNGDGRANPYDCDSDGDGIVDVIESGLPDTNFDGWIDGTIGTDGWSINVKALVSLGLRNTDGRGNPDYLDIDADDDGIPDNIEGMATTAYQLPTYTDTDNDGLDNRYDTRVGYGGAGIFVFDKDGDGIPDYRDLDTDADGFPDIIEGNDFNLNGIADDDVSLTLLDTDGDGLDNRFDSLNSVLNIKGTSYRMGNGGVLSGDASPGSRTPVQQTLAGAPDRDWRSVGSVLYVNFLQLTGSLQKSNARLEWKINSSAPVDHFELERSINGGPFVTVAAIHETLLLNQLQSFNYIDNMFKVGSGQISYRVKVISRSGHIACSNGYLVNIKQPATVITISPNPAKEFINISFASGKKASVTIQLLDNNGKILLVQKRLVSRGNNVIKLFNLQHFPEGMYAIQMLMDGEVFTEKLMLLTRE